MGIKILFLKIPQPLDKGKNNVYTYCVGMYAKLSLNGMMEKNPQ
jgi:hypothetical protein